jgi:hypothetical protein
MLFLPDIHDLQTADSVEILEEEDGILSTEAELARLPLPTQADPSQGLNKIMNKNAFHGLQLKQQF